MRVRQRQAAARQFVAERHRALIKCGEEDAAFRPGEVVYRKGQPCTVVAVGYDTCPPHIVVRTSDGHEVGTEPSYLERLAPASPRRPLALTGKRSARADVRDIRPTALAAPGMEDVVVTSSPASTSERHAALARMRNRRAERAAEAARERDDTLADLLDDRHESNSEAQMPRAPPAQAKKSDSRHERAADLETPRPRPALPKQLPAARHRCEQVANAEMPAELLPMANSPEVEAVSTQSDGTPVPALDTASDACMSEARGEAGACDGTTVALAGDANVGLAVDTASPNAREIDITSRTCEERAPPDGAAEISSELAAEVAAEATFEAMQDLSSSGLAVLPPESAAFSDEEIEDENDERTEEAERLRRQEEERSRVAELEAERKSIAEQERRMAEQRRKEEEEEKQRLAEEARIQAELEAEKKRREAEEKERSRREAELERRRLEAEQLEQERKRKEWEEAERRRKEEEERLRIEAEEAERKRQEAEERLRKEAEEARREQREAEEAEQRRREAEETERRMREAEEAERKRMEEDEHRGIPPLQHFHDVPPCPLASEWEEEDLRYPAESLLALELVDASGESTESIQDEICPQAPEHQALAYTWPLHDLPEDDADDVDELLHNNNLLNDSTLPAEDRHADVEADEGVRGPQWSAQDVHPGGKTEPESAVETQNGVQQISNAPVDVLLCLDASFSMHAPLALAQRPVSSWSEDDWDEFGQHLRTRCEPCRLEPLGLAALDLITGALRGLAVEVHFCGEDDSEPVRYGLVEANDVKSRWKRALLRGPNLWSRVADDLVRLQGCGLQQVVVLTSAEDDLGRQAPCAEAYQTVGQIALAGVPVHVVRFGAPPSSSAPAPAQVSSSIAAASGGSHTTLLCHENFLKSPESIHAEIAAVLRSLRNLPRLHPSRPLISEAELHAAASIIQRAERARRKKQQTRLLAERKAVAHIEAAYSGWRLRRSIAAAALEGKRARKRAPVEEALRRRRATKYQADADAAARRIQSEWRSRRIRLWCQKIDRAARRLQNWCRTRWLRERLERQAVVEAKALEIRRRRIAQAPPLPPSQWQQMGMTLPSAPGSWQVEPRAIYLADTAQAANSSESARSTANYGIRPLGSSALQACPPPMKKPPLKPRGGGCMSSLIPPADCFAPAGAPPIRKRPGLRFGAATFGSTAAATAPVGGFATSEGNLPRIGGATTLPRLPPATGSSSSPRHLRSSPKVSPRRVLDAVF
mmetsp:Transcript_7827/g.13695  ORF Transcript_7827/g.13695 Transcript_7827/m.13695 type:complete len:1227 (-) Transcript_7827:32-3712(-)